MITRGYVGRSFAVSLKKGQAFKNSAMNAKQKYKTIVSE